MDITTMFSEFRCDRIVGLTIEDIADCEVAYFWDTLYATRRDCLHYHRTCTLFRNGNRSISSSQLTTHNSNVEPVYLKLFRGTSSHNSHYSQC